MCNASASASARECVHFHIIFFLRSGKKKLLMKLGSEKKPEKVNIPICKKMTTFKAKHVGEEIVSLRG